MNNTAKTIKLILSSSFVLLAFLGMAIHPSLFSLFLLVGTLFSWHGDIAITRIGVFGKVYWSHFLIAMISFAAGLICYTIAFFTRGFAVKAFLAAVPVYGSITVVIWGALMYHKETPAHLRLDSLAYGLILSATASAAVALFLTRGGGWIVAAIGAVLFLVSDSFIGACELGKRKIPAYDLLVWTVFGGSSFNFIEQFFVKTPETNLHGKKVHGPTLIEILARTPK